MARSMLVAALPFLSAVAVGQQSIRPSATGASASSLRKVTDSPGEYNLRLGPTYWDASAGLSVTYYDNVALGSKNKESDVVIAPSITLGGSWQVTRYNLLKLTLGLSYSKYLNDSSLDSSTILISPDSALEFDIFVGDFTINLHDRFSILQNPIDLIDVSGVAHFERFQNAAGVSVLWDLNDVKLVAGYDHFNFWSLESKFGYLDRGEEQVYLSASAALSDAWQVGMDVSGAYFYYFDDVQNDGWTFSAGPFVEGQLSNYLALRASVGYQQMGFDSGGANLDNDDSHQGGYGEVSLSHRLNRQMTESLSTGYETRLGLNANYLGTFFVRYLLNWQVNSKLDASIEGLYENAQESDVQTGPEDSDRFAVGVSLGYRLGKRVSVGLNYRYTQKFSNLPYRDYRQNAVSASLSYDF